MMTVLVPMTDDEFESFGANSISAYAADKVASREWAQHEATTKAERVFHDLLPQGRSTRDHYLLSVREAASGTPVGGLWFAMQRRGDQTVAYVYDIRIEAAHRGRGHGTRAFQALEQHVAALGATGISLHVFGHNTVARGLYEKLGYAPTSIIMYRSVAAGPV